MVIRMAASHDTSLEETTKNLSVASPLAVTTTTMPPAPSSAAALRRVRKTRRHERNTKAEFRRLKTILPSIKRKENVSRLDIILEAIKYIDSLQDQLIDRLTLSGPQRLAQLTEKDMLERLQQQQQADEDLLLEEDEQMLVTTDDDDDEEELVRVTAGFAAAPFDEDGDDGGALSANDNVEEEEDLVECSSPDCSI